MAADPLLELDSLTQRERAALPDLLNLADGHARPKKESTIRPLLGTAFDYSFERSQTELESAFLQAFMVEASGQTLLSEPFGVYLSYSASSTIELIAKYFARHGLSIGLIEPIFDNIPRILAYSGVPMVAVPERDVRRLSRTDDLAGVDVLWLVMPNNPTSWQLPESRFREVVRLCARQGILLVLDLCFRQFSTDMLRFDQYAILEQEGGAFITIEDTGKTWGSQEIKVGVSVCSPGLSEEMQVLHENLLLRVSPFHLAVLERLIAERSHLRETRRLVEKNRGLLKQQLVTLGYRFASSSDGSWSLPMDWVEIPSELKLTANEYCRLLAHNRGVQLLPGERFYWRNPELGAHMFRIALNRDSKVVESAAEHMMNEHRLLLKVG